MENDMNDKNFEITVLEAARQVAVYAELLEAGTKNINKMSSDGARNARKDIAEAIARLTVFQERLTKRVEGH